MKTVIEMAREAGVLESHEEYFSDDIKALERFAALVREDAISTFNHRMNQLCEEARLSDDSEQKPRHISYACPICAGTLIEDEQPFTALAARQMRDAAVKMIREKFLNSHELEEICAWIGVLSLPEVQWRDLTDEEIFGSWKAACEVIPTCDRHKHFAKAVIAKFKEKQL